MVLDFFKGDVKTVQKIKQYSATDFLSITSLTYFELLSSIKGQAKWDVLKVVDKMDMLNFDKKAAGKAHRLYAQALETKANLGMREIINASICLANDALLLTKNRQAYEGIKDLKFV